MVGFFVEKEGLHADLTLVASLSVSQIVCLGHRAGVHRVIACLKLVTLADLIFKIVELREGIN